MSEFSRAALCYFVHHDTLKRRIKATAESSTLCPSHTEFLRVTQDMSGIKRPALHTGVTKSSRRCHQFRVTGRSRFPLMVVVVPDPRPPETGSGSESKITAHLSPSLRTSSAHISVSETMFNHKVFSSAKSNPNGQLLSKPARWRPSHQIVSQSTMICLLYAQTQLHAPDLIVQYLTLCTLWITHSDTYVDTSQTFTSPSTISQ